ncbi:MAG: endonuclease [Candidatus Cloacimonadales bacterium]
MKKIVLSLSLLLALFSAEAEVIAGDLSGDILLQFLADNYKTTYTLGYDEARDIMYSEIDLQPYNLLECVYSGFTIELDPSLDPSTDAFYKGINCEHTWPQSYGSGSEPQKSDMHHLFPSKDNVNSSRGNSPFAENIDTETDKWYYNDIVLEEIPLTNIDKYSEKDNGGSGYFEPRESHKGDAARAVFYFYTMYQDVADDDFFLEQKDILFKWHIYDPVSEVEMQRSDAIAEYQDYPNPFVIDETLINRIWYQDFLVQDRALIDQQKLSFIEAEDFVSGKSFVFTNCYEADIYIEEIFFDTPDLFQTNFATTDFPLVAERLVDLEINVLALDNQRDLLSDTLRIVTEQGIFSLEVEYDPQYIVEAETDLLPLAELSNYPNPFNPTAGERASATTISYSLDSAASPEISIYNARGEKVKSFSELAAGRGEVIWNGKDAQDKIVPSGIYFYRLQSDNFSKTAKMLLLK